MVLASSMLKHEACVTVPRLNASVLDLRPLYYLVQVAENGSFSRAASSLSVSQPTLSRFIRQLEQVHKVQLLYRNGRGVVPTAAGERLLEHARIILRGVSQAHLEIAAIRDTPVGSICVALPPLLGGMLSVDLVQKLRTYYPLVSISLREGFATEIFDWLSFGSVDIGIMFNPPQISTLISELLLDDYIHLVGAPESLDLPPRNPFTARNLAGLPLVLPPTPHRLRALIEGVANQLAFELNVEVEVTGTNTILELVRNKIGYTVLPSVLLNDEIAEGRLVGWPLVEPEMATHLYIATSMQKPQTLASKVVTKLVKQILAEKRGSIPRKENA